MEHIKYHQVPSIAQGPIVNPNRLSVVWGSIVKKFLDPVTKCPTNSSEPRIYQGTIPLSFCMVTHSKDTLWYPVHRLSLSVV